jgi:hypothetical protein
MNTGYYSIYPNVGGTFDKTNAEYDGTKHPVTFRFRTRAPLRALAEQITVEIERLADVSGYIDEFVDISAEAGNESLMPGGMFSIAGHKIKIAGDDPDVGVYFVSEADASVRVKASGHLAENAASKLIGIIPALGAGTWLAEIKTQYSAGAVF